MRTRLAALPDDTRAIGAARVAEAVFAAARELLGDGPVALFASLDIEIDTAPLDDRLRRAGAARVFPRITDDELVFHQVPADLAGADQPIGSFRVPTPDATWPTVALGECAVIVVPGLAFDETGRRLGWGRGYYDRALRGMAGERERLVVAIGLDAQIVPEVPAGADDVRVRALCTPGLGLRRTIW